MFYERIIKERDDLKAYAREMSKFAMREAGGGSEMFKTVAGEPFADPVLCEEKIRQRKEAMWKLQYIKDQKRAKETKS